jgi:serine/threonine protein kinase/tetratricopeptide (TPR) repeat protein
MAFSTDEELNYGALAVRMGFIEPQQFARIVVNWLSDPAESLGEHLLGLKVISSHQKQQLDQLASSGKSPREVSDDATKEQHITTPQRGDELTSIGTLSYDGSHTREARYATLRPLASGGLGKVSVAIDKELQREVALKEILNGTNATPDQLERFLAEAKITGGLEHPGIVPVYGLEIDSDGTPRYAMRLIRGQSLQESLKKFHKNNQSHKLDSGNEGFRVLIRAIIDACNAVAYAHSRGVIHRDIKPHNIMLGKFGETLVVDWGLAKVVDHHDELSSMSEMPMQDNRSGDSHRTTMGSVLGTLGFMSPEQSEGRLDVLTFATDVFSLGATLYAILCGKPPYSEGSREEMLRASSIADFEPPLTVNPKVPKSLSAICTKAMARRPSDRYASPVELAEDLDRWSVGEPVTAMAEPVAQWIFRLGKRHQTAVVATLGMITVGLSASLLANYAISKQRNIAQIKSAAAIASAEEATQQRAKAEKNSDASLAIVDEFVKQIADDKWSEFPGFESARISMVDLASERCQQLLADDTDNEKLRYRVIQLLTRSSTLHRLVGENQTAQSRVDDALAALESLSDDTSDSRIGLEVDVLSTGILCSKATHGAPAALLISQKCLDISRERTNRFPASPQAKIGLARALLQHAELTLEVSRPAEAREYARHAADHFATLCQNYDTIFALHALHCGAHKAIAESYLQEKRFDDCKAAAQIAIELGRQAKQKFQGNNNIIDFAQSPVMTLAKCDIAERDAQSSITKLEESLQVYEDLAQQHPTVKNYQKIQAEIYSQLAIGHYSLSNVDDALAAAKRSIEILDKLSGDREEVVSYLPERIKALAVEVLLTPEAHNVDLQANFRRTLDQLISTNASHPELLSEVVVQVTKAKDLRLQL